MATWIVLALLVIAAILLWLDYKKKQHAKEKVLPATNFILTYIKKDGLMELYTGAWTTSTSTFSDHQQVLVGLNGAAPSQQGADLAASIDTQDFAFPTGDTVDIIIRTVGDNGSVDDLIVPQFTATNQEKVAPATGFNLTYKGHKD